MELNITASQVTISTSYDRRKVDVTLSGIEIDNEEIAKQIPLSTIFEAHGENDILKFGIENYGWTFEEEE